MVKGLKYRILEVEGLYFVYSGHSGAGQMCVYLPAYLTLCFRIRKNQICFIMRFNLYRFSFLCRFLHIHDKNQFRVLHTQVCFFFNVLSFQGAIVAIKKINKVSITVHKPLLLEIKRVSTALCHHNSTPPYTPLIYCKNQQGQYNRPQATSA